MLTTSTGSTYHVLSPRHPGSLQGVLSPPFPIDHPFTINAIWSTIFAGHENEVFGSGQDSTSVREARPPSDHIWRGARWLVPR